MQHLKFLPFIFFLLFIRQGHAQNSPTETVYLSMEMAIDRALEKNHLLRASHFAAKKATWEKRQAWSQLLPTVSFNTRYSWIDDSTFALRDFSRYFRSDDNQPGPGLGFDIPQTVFQNSWYTSFDVQMTLFNGVVWNGISYAGAAEDAAQSQYTSTRNLILFQVISGYLSALYAGDVAKIQKEYERLSKLNYEKAQRMQQAGRYSRVEALRWKVEWQQQKSVVSQSKSAKRSALVALARLTASAMDRPLQIDSGIPGSIEREADKLLATKERQLLDMIKLSESELVKANAALAAVKSSEEMSKLFYRGAYSKFLPNINLNYSYSWRENNTLQLDDYSPQMLAVNFSWPLFSGFQDYTALQASRYQYKQGREQFADELHNLNFTLTQTVNRLIDLKTQYAMAKDNVELSQSNYDIVAKQKEQGLVSNIDFIDAKLNLQNTQLQLVKNKYDFISSMVELYYLLGKLETLL